MTKMASDEDEDDNESMIGDTMAMKAVPDNTQGSEGSTTTYAWVILFSTCVDEECPFKIVRLSHFKNTDFPWNLITGELTADERNRVRKFNNMDEESFCVFAKVEHGKVF